MKEANVLKAYSVKVGTTNGIRTQIISGVKQGVEVITGSKAQAELSESTDESSDSEQSPFAPSPRKNDKKGKK